MATYQQTLMADKKKKKRKIPHGALAIYSLKGTEEDSLLTVMEVRAELAPKLFNLSLQESYNIVLQPFIFKAK